METSFVRSWKPARRGKSARVTEIAELRDYFCSKPFDQAFTAYYPQEIVDKYDITSPYKALRFTASRLKLAGYRGWYVISVHDKKRDGFGSTLWHPHMMLDGRNGQMERVRQAFFPVADINCNKNGPILDLRGWGLYCALRACERGLDSEYYRFEFMGETKPRRRRGSRGRGSSKKTQAQAVAVTGGAL